jgi:hypothetical protein
MRKSGVHVACVPQDQSIQHETECAELVFLTLAIPLPQFASLSVKNNPGQAVPAPHGGSVGSACSAGTTRRPGEAEAGFRSLTEAIDTTTPAGRMMMQMVGAFAEFERAMLR